MADPEVHKTLLIVDDIVDDLLMFEDVIEELGHTPLLALTPTDAKDYLKRHKPDLIVWNTDVPKSWDELKILLKVKPTKDIPFIAIISGTNDKAAETALKLGCIGLMRKPIAEGIIAEVLEQGLRPQKSVTRKLERAARRAAEAKKKSAKPLPARK